MGDLLDRCLVDILNIRIRTIGRSNTSNDRPCYNRSGERQQQAHCECQRGENHGPRSTQNHFWYPPVIFFFVVFISVGWSKLLWHNNLLLCWFDYDGGRVHNPSPFVNLWPLKSMRNSVPTRWWRRQSYYERWRNWNDDATTQFL